MFRNLSWQFREHCLAIIHRLEIAFDTVTSMSFHTTNFVRADTVFRFFYLPDHECAVNVVLVFYFTVLFLVRHHNLWNFHFFLNAINISIYFHFWLCYKIKFADLPSLPSEMYDSTPLLVCYRWGGCTETGRHCLSRPASAQFIPPASLPASHLSDSAWDTRKKTNSGMRQKREGREREREKESLVIEQHIVCIYFFQIWCWIFSKNDLPKLSWPEVAFISQLEEKVNFLYAYSSWLTARELGAKMWCFFSSRHRFFEWKISTQLWSE